jgi:hypothetical protein
MSRVRVPHARDFQFSGSPFPFGLPENAVKICRLPFDGFKALKKQPAPSLTKVQAAFSGSLRVRQIPDSEI